MAKITPQTLLKKKKSGQKITMLTAYEFTIASLLEEANIDIIFVGDSLGNVFQGLDSTLPVTMDHMIYHTQAVKRATKNSLLLADLPFMSYHLTENQTKENACRLIKEGGAEALKIELNPTQVDTLKTIVDIGIPVIAHIGFIPQQIHALGGYKVQGKTQPSFDQLLALAKECEKAGACAIVLELMTQELAKAITDSLEIPTIGIGAGKHCDGQVLVTQDLLGLSGKHQPKFVKKYGDLHQNILTMIDTFKKEVQNADYPGKEHSYSNEP